MKVDDLELADPPKKSFFEALMIVGTCCIMFSVVPMSLFCLAVAKDIEVKPVGPDFDPMRFGTAFSIVLMILLINAPIGFACAALGRLVASTRLWKWIFGGSAIYMLTVFLATGAVFLWA